VITPVDLLSPTLMAPPIGDPVSQASLEVGPPTEDFEDQDLQGTWPFTKDSYSLTK
jgi:hypothetical protein